MGTINDYTNFHQKMAGYQIVDQDVDSSDSDVTYYGHVNQEGEYFIMKEDLSVSDDADLKAWRFNKGSSGYATAWSGREALSYDTFINTFK